MLAILSVQLRWCNASRASSMKRSMQDPKMSA
jgi:hypothetical protein